MPSKKSIVVNVSKERKQGKFKGVTVKKDKDGFFVTTHRARSKSFPTVNQIPKKTITFIESTG